MMNDPKCFCPLLPLGFNTQCTSLFYHSLITSHSCTNLVSAAHVFSSGPEASQRHDVLALDFSVKDTVFHATHLAATHPASTTINVARHITQFMKSLIEVYVHSISPYVDYELASEMSQHVFCDPSMATKASETFLQFNKFKGRSFPDEDWTVLQRLAEASHTDDRIKVYDISHITDRFKALTRGITTTPVIIINGKKHEGAQKSLDALDKQSLRKL